MLRSTNDDGVVVEVCEGEEHMEALLGGEMDLVTVVDWIVEVAGIAVMDGRWGDMDEELFVADSSGDWWAAKVLIPLLVCEPKRMM